MRNWYKAFKTASDDSEDEEYRYFGDPKEWHLGQMAIMSHAGLDDFSVVEVRSLEELAQNSEYYEMTGPGQVRWNHPYGGSVYREGEMVPIRLVEPFGVRAEAKTTFDNGYALVGAQNLFRTIDAMVQKMGASIYPDLLIKFWQSDKYKQLVQEFPQLKEKQSVLDQIDYQSFDVDGYTVTVIADPSFVDQQVPYYWAIPEMNLRSVNLPSVPGPGAADILSKIRSPQGLYRFRTVQEALRSAEMYLNYMFPTDPDQVGDSGSQQQPPV